MNTDDVTCVMQLETRKKGVWSHYSARKMDQLPWNQVAEKGKGLPDDVSRHVSLLYNCHNREFAVFGETSVSQDCLEKSGYISEGILKETQADELRLVVWYMSWEIGGQNAGEPC